MDYQVIYPCYFSDKRIVHDEIDEKIQASWVIFNQKRIHEIIKNKDYRINQWRKNNLRNFKESKRNLAGLNFKIDDLVIKNRMIKFHIPNATLHVTFPKKNLFLLHKIYKRYKNL